MEGEEENSNNSYKFILQPPAVDLDCQFDIFRYGGISFFSWDATRDDRNRQFVQAVTKITCRKNGSDYCNLSMEGSIWKRGTYEKLKAECRMNLESVPQLKRWVLTINERAVQQGSQKAIELEEN